ncbi:unnamed protein product [Adineta ricciae]|uniref:HTH CENPB-type domain-containing protein n=1 Tax=Adineta ricciae TaxID=249248 RepID=A0A814NQT1_ADIRI|nr:unnamed protein product [Adineta ricciae]
MIHFHNVLKVLFKLSSNKISRNSPSPINNDEHKQVIQKNQKFDDVDIYVYDRFQHARHNFLSVHDVDFRRWSLKNAHQLHLKGLQASEGWLWNFKVRHSICSQRITKLLTKKVIENQEEINESAKYFVLETGKITEGYSPNQVLNTDQIGIELEPHNNRTLTHGGEKSTWGSVSDWILSTVLK